jgi:hypothetical protein
MALSPAFEYVCGELESRTGLDRLAARGTVRLTLKDIGLDPSSVQTDQMVYVVTKLLPQQLAGRGVDGAETLCEDVAQGVVRVAGGAVPETPESVFARLGD